ncbi:Aste57867_18697 [Aphanomyces stellatus]|uniref:Aste57867_18697 protein n=1 Tax=Aphanomyces stellatus TaxID=120398 RepID=A0A485LCA4_9STRA|nr:hypothetical protein As57867_018634 [Aphanomyces stellatus]VFT95432.1 Aste57867_18697 [Aphanomyces stellatus]
MNYINETKQRRATEKARKSVKRHSGKAEWSDACQFDRERHSSSSPPPLVFSLMTATTMMPLLEHHDQRTSHFRRQGFSDPTFNLSPGRHPRARAATMPQSCAIPVGGLAYGVDISGDSAFVSCINNVTMVNLREKRACARVSVTGTARALAATPSGKAVYVACQDGGLSVLACLGDTLALAQHCNVSAVGVAMCRSKTLAVVACEQSGLCFFDTRTHTLLSMRPIHIHGATLRAKAVAIQDDRYAYVACNAGVVAVVDFADPRQPVLHASKKLFHGDAHAIALSEAGDMAYVACGPKGVCVVDALAFASRGHVKSAYGSVFDVRVVGSLLLCACQMGGLAVYAIERHGTLALLGQTNAFDGISHGVGGIWVGAADHSSYRMDALVTCQSGGIQLVSLDGMSQWPGPKKAGLGDACSIM